MAATMPSRPPASDTAIKAASGMPMKMIASWMAPGRVTPHRPDRAGKATSSRVAMTAAQADADDDARQLDGIGQGYAPQARQGRVGNKQQRGNDGRPGGVQANDGQGAFGGPDLGADNADNGQQREQGGQRGHRFAAVAIKQVVGHGKFGQPAHFPCRHQAQQNQRQADPNRIGNTGDAVAEAPFARTHDKSAAKMGGAQGGRGQNQPQPAAGKQKVGGVSYQS